MVCVARTNIDIDDALVERVMRLHNLSTKREAVHLALERLVGAGPMAVKEQLAMRGMGFEPDLDELRSTAHVEWADRAAR